MFRFIKFIPVILLAGGCYYGAKHFQPFFDKVVTKVKVLVTGLELGRMRDELSMHTTLHGEIPGEESQEEFSEWLRKNFSPYWGDRDTANDYWDNPYQMLPTDDEDMFLLFSMGPNGEEDACSQLNGMGQPVDMIPPDDPADIEAEPVARSDDICMTVELSIADTAFRPLE